MSHLAPAPKRPRAVARSLATGLLLQATVAASGILAARLLGVEDRGRLALLWVTAILVGQLVTLGAHAAVPYAIAQGRSERAVLADLRGVLLAQLIAAPCLQGAALLLLLDDVSSAHLVAAASTLVTSPMIVLLLYALAAGQGARRYEVLQRHRVLQPAIYVAALVTLLVVDAGSLPLVAGLWSATMVVGGLWAWRECTGLWWPGAPESGHRRRRGELLRFGRRSLLGAFGATEHFMLDQLLVALLLPLRDLGLFVAAAAFANLPRFLGQSVGYIAYPEVAGARTDAARRTRVRRYFLLGAAVAVPVVGALVVAVDWLLPFLFGEDFAPAVPVAQVLLVAALIQALRRILTEASRGMGSGTAGTAGEVVFTVVLLGTGLWLAPAHGARGVAVAVLLAAVCALALLLALLRRPTPDAGRPDAPDPPTGLDAGAQSALLPT